MIALINKVAIVTGASPGIGRATALPPVFYQPDDQTLISTVTMEAQSRATGRIVHMPMCQLLKIKDGLPIEWRTLLGTLHN